MFGELEKDVKEYLIKTLTPTQKERLLKIIKVFAGITSHLFPFGLRQLAALYGSDKGDEVHTCKGLSYLDIYERYLRPLKYEPITILEIGVLGGASLRMWKRYFPNSKVFGLDINPAAKQHQESRICIEIGSQADDVVLEKLTNKANGFDLIIDDGSHVNNHIIKSYNCLFQHLRKGGIYIIEDLGCSYEKLEEISVGDGRKGVREIWPGMQYNSPNESMDNDRQDLDQFFTSIIHDLDRRRGEVLSIHFWSYLAIILKH